jgi:hypothetical protein
MTKRRNAHPTNPTPEQMLRDLLAQVGVATSNYEEQVLEGGERIIAHKASACRQDKTKKVSRPCPIHGRTDHAMRAFPQHWRDDRGIMERICPHGIGHPDPDDSGDDGVHGCDGCCRPPA